jgi:hypothetical protein
MMEMKQYSGDVQKRIAAFAKMRIVDFCLIIFTTMSFWSLIAAIICALIIVFLCLCCCHFRIAFVCCCCHFFAVLLQLLPFFLFCLYVCFIPLLLYLFSSHLSLCHLFQSKISAYKHYVQSGRQ